MANQHFTTINRAIYDNSLSKIDRDRPTFLFIGTLKSEATWIFEVLRAHPDVFVPMAKEIHFFDDYYDRGWNWYLRHFKNAGSAAALGEMTTDYWSSADAARRIRRDLPEVRLVCCLREPGEFAASLLRWWYDHFRRRYGSTFRDMTEHPVFIRQLAYRQNLQVYFDLFPREQIHIAYYEDMKFDPYRCVRELYRFVCVDPDYRPAVLAGRIDATGAPRSRTLLRSGTAGAAFLRRCGAHTLAGAMEPVFAKLACGGADRAEDPATEIELERIAENVRRRAANDLPALAQLIGAPLPAEWTSEAARNKAMGRKRGNRIPATSATYGEL